MTTKIYFALESLGWGCVSSLGYWNLGKTQFSWRQSGRVSELRQDSRRYDVRQSLKTKACQPREEKAERGHNYSLATFTEKENHCSSEL